MTKITYQYSYIKKWLCCFTRFLVFEGHRLTHVRHRPFWTGRLCAECRPPELCQSLWSAGAGWWSTDHHPLLLLCSGVWYWNTDGPEKTYTARVRWWSKMDDTLHWRKRCITWSSGFFLLLIFLWKKTWKTYYKKHMYIKTKMSKICKNDFFKPEDPGHFHSLHPNKTTQQTHKSTDRDCHHGNQYRGLIS